MGMTFGPKPIDTNGLTLFFDGTNANDFIFSPNFGVKWKDPIKKHEGRANLIGSPLLQSPVYDNDYKSILFNGFNDRFEITPSGTDAYLNDNFTIHFWWNENYGGSMSARNRTILDIPNRLSFYLWAGNISQPQIWTPTGTPATYSLPYSNTWNHFTIVGSVSGSNITYYVYLNGSPVRFTGNQSQYTIPLPSADYSPRSIYIGGTSSGWSGNFCGYLGMVAMYNYAMSGTQIASFYNATKDRFKIPSTPIRWTQDGLRLFLDASNPNSYPGSGNIWYDISGYGNHATFAGTSTPVYGNDGSITFDYNCSATVPYSASYCWNDMQSHTIIITISPNVTAYNNYLLSRGGQFNIMYIQNNNMTGSYGGTPYQSYYPNIWTFRCENRSVHTYGNTIPLAYSEGNPYIIWSNDTSSSFNISPSWSGKIYQLLIYNKPLSMAEISQNVRYFNKW